MKIKFKLIKAMKFVFKLINLLFFFLSILKINTIKGEKSNKYISLSLTLNNLKEQIDILSTKLNFLNSTKLDSESMVIFY